MLVHCKEWMIKYATVSLTLMSPSLIRVNDFDMISTSMSAVTCLIDLTSSVSNVQSICLNASSMISSPSDPFSIVSTEDSTEVMCYNSIICHYVNAV